MIESKINIVISRYNKNIDFVYKINNNKNINVIIYDKEDSNSSYNVPVNKGQEASSYLKYIVDYYDNLTDFTFFIHDDEFAWHHSGSLIDKFDEAVKSNEKYYNVNDRCVWFSETDIAFRMCYDDLLVWYNEYIEEYIPFSQVPNNKNFLDGYTGSAQFLIHKDLIRNLPKEFYKKLYDWITTTDIPNWKTSRFLEWTWHIFWVIYPTYIQKK